MPTLTKEEASTRVKKGIALLNEQKAKGRFFPGTNPDPSAPGTQNWCDLIDLSMLQMSNSCLCVLGQVYRRYLRGCEYLRLNNPTGAYKNPHNAAPDYGFDLYCNEVYPDSYALLNEVWTEEITKLQQQTLIQEPPCTPST